MEQVDIHEIERIAETAQNSRIRAEIWGDFVGWDGRRRGENGFLVSQLRKINARKVLDVALGDGVDTIFLLENGFSVDCNEYDTAFREKARENAKGKGFSIAPTALDWRKLDEVYVPDSEEAVVCMGNSLTCLPKSSDCLNALVQFHRVLKPSGVLLIDERNYQKLLDNREAVLSGTFHSKVNKVYTGTEKVKARFLKLEDDDIVIEYRHISGKVAYYHAAYPFKRGEMLRLLQDAGFSEVSKFSDYELGDNPDADFFQYVCVK